MNPSYTELLIHRSLTRLQSAKTGVMEAYQSLLNEPLHRDLRAELLRIEVKLTEASQELLALVARKEVK